MKKKVSHKKKGYTEIPWGISVDYQAANVGVGHFQEGLRLK